MKPNWLFLQIVLAVLFVFAANVGIQWAASSSLPRKLLAKAKRAEGVTDLFFGDSLMARGYDEAAFAALGLDRSLSIWVWVRRPA